VNEFKALEAYFASMNTAKEPPSASTPGLPVVGQATPYAKAALDQECLLIASTAEGSRNHQLNTSMFKLSQLIAGGELDQADTENALTQAALTAGLSPSEIKATLKSGFRAGSQHPRGTPVPTVVEHIDPVTGEILTDNEQPSEADTLGLGPMDELWTAKPWLTHIRDFAWARTCSPFAVLGCFLANLAARIPHTVVLPPIVGGVGSLNLLVALVGPSGAGKGAAKAAADAAFRWPLLPKVTTFGLGTGEGIAAAYAHTSVKKKDEEEKFDGITWDRRTALFVLDEIDSLASQSQRQGATIMPQLRQAFSGESLGYKIKSDPLTIPAHEYRFVTIMGVQPGRGKVLLQDADGGTPQRILWCHATDPFIPDEPPAEPLPWVIELPAWGDVLHQDLFGRLVIEVEEAVAQIIRINARQRARGHGDALDGHALYVQEKVAFFIAVAEGRYWITLDDWILAGRIMAGSNHAREQIQMAGRLEQAAKEQASISRQLNVIRAQDEYEEVKQARAIPRVAKRIAKTIQERGTMDMWEVRRHAVAHRDRWCFEEALEEAETQGWVSKEGLVISLGWSQSWK